MEVKNIYKINSLNGITHEFLEKSISILLLQIDSWKDDDKYSALTYLEKVINSDEILSSIKIQKDNLSRKMSDNKFDINELWLYISPEQRTKFGQFFTPLEIVNHILDVCQTFKKDFIIGQGIVADISCGSGIFLQEFIRRQLKHKDDNINPIIALKRTIGFDKDPLACSIAKLSIAFEVCDMARKKDHSFDKVNEWSLPRIYCLDSLSNGRDIDSFSKREYPDDLQKGIDAVIGNFPFLEAKRMNGVDPNLKTILKNRFPRLFGAFDLYVPFVYQSLQLLRKGGIFGVVLPNKFLVAKYARYLRKTLLEENQLLQISDFSQVKNSFYKTSVYPIVLFFQKGKMKHPQREISTLTTNRLEELKNEQTYKLDLELFNLTGQNFTFFCRNHDYFEHLKNIFLSDKSTRLGDIAKLRTTVSFHETGIREKFIRPLHRFGDKPKNQLYSYLGGESYAKKNEVDSFLIDWQEYYIWYPPDMKKLTGHNVAPLDIFLRPKIVFCQHSQRLRAYFDEKGTFITKDVYPIAFAENNNDRIFNGWLLTAYFNSSIFSILYNTVYHGITIGGAYYHYLPAFLNEIRFILPDEEMQKNIVNSAKNIQEQLNENREINKVKIRKIYNDLDLKISLINGLSKEEHKELIEQFRRQGIIQPWDN